MFSFSLLVVLALFNSVLSLPLTSLDLKCGYAKCPKFDESKINVHIIAQTHDDVGWLYTVDQYYYREVQYILDTVVHELHSDPNKKFIYVEIAFFWKWWKEQSGDTRKIVEQLVQNGQLEFVGGGWSMNDEATTYYQQIIDQMTWGFRRLNDTFGECATPRIGWQIDPFGHSKEQASLFAQMNFDAFFFTRLDYQDRTERINNKNLEFIWRGNEELGKSSDIFTGLVQLGYGYGSPPGFCFDLIHCDSDKINDPFIDDDESEDNNINQKVNDFLIYVALFAQHYTTNNVFVTIGSDFQFTDAFSYFKNIDKLIKYVNEKQSSGSKFNVFYSTPSCYLQAVHQSNKTYAVKTDDFFPYGSDAHSYWTGYFTSRPALKYNDRRSNNVLQACKQLNALTSLKMDSETIPLKEAMGVNQHHDAVSGTERQLVAQDYALLLAKGVTRCERVISEAYQKLLPKTTAKILKQDFCESLNISACYTSENSDQIAVTLYNPIARSVDYLLRVPVAGDSFTVLNSNAQSVAFDLISIPDYIIDLPDRYYGTESTAVNEVVFTANIPPLGFTTYFINAKNGNSMSKPVEEVKTSFTLKGKTIEVEFSSTGTLESIKLANGQTVSLKQSFLYYKSTSLNNREILNRSSGAYVFRPNSQPINLSVDVKSNLTKGSIVQEVRQNLTNWVRQAIRVYPDKDYIEFDWVIGPIPKEWDEELRTGKEVVIRFNTNLNTNALFYTDANGRQILERKRNFSPTYNITITEPVAANYYPVNSRIYIKDVKQDIQMTLVNDRSQGGSSLEDGSIELMLHRRIFHDDAFGVTEPLDEPGADYSGLVVRGQTVLYFSTIDSAAKFHRDIAQRINLSPIITFANYSSSVNEYMSAYNTMGSTLNNALPDNVNLLTLEEWKNDQILLRLEHFYSAKDDPKGLSNSVTVDLSKLFKPFTIKSATETSLGANQYVSNAQKRMVFRSDVVLGDVSLGSGDNGLNIALTPMQIRTFLVSLK